MKTQFFYILYFTLITACNQSSKNANSTFDLNNKDSCTIRISCADKELLDKAHKIINSGEKYSKILFDSFVEKNGFLPKNNLTPEQKDNFLKQRFYGMEERFAKRYVKEFDGSLARHSMHQNDNNDLDNEYVGEVSFSNGSFSTLCALELNGQIDGVRAYLSKYRDDPMDRDPNLGNTKRYSVILVGTRISGSVATDVLIPSTPRGSYLISVQNYAQPCKPHPCPSAKLYFP